MAQKDITGQRFNKLVAIKFIEKRNDIYFWLFRCNCGKEKIIRKSEVINGYVKSCGCLKKESMMGDKNPAKKRIKNITGQKFGRLIAIKFEYIKNERHYWLFRCDCGKEKIIAKNCVVYKYSKTKSCGCLNLERCKRGIRKTHGFGDRKIRNRFYTIWGSIKQRCLNKKLKYYKNYGGRGIKVCDRWLKFENFRNDMYKSYLEHVKEFGERNTSIDRKNNDGDYYKENCRWATLIEQMNNTRTNKFISYKQKYVTVSELAKILNINYETLRIKTKGITKKYEEVFN